MGREDELRQDVHGHHPFVVPDRTRTAASSRPGTRSRRRTPCRTRRRRSPGSAASVRRTLLVLTSRRSCSLQPRPPPLPTPLSGRAADPDDLVLRDPVGRPRRTPRSSGPGPTDSPIPAAPCGSTSGAVLHLRIERRHGRWYCAELTTQHGIRVRHVHRSGPPAGPRTSIRTSCSGLFTWDSHGGEHHREIDIELGRWGERAGPNAQFVVQPVSGPGEHPPVRHRGTACPDDPGVRVDARLRWSSGACGVTSSRTRHVGER